MNIFGKIVPLLQGLKRTDITHTYFCSHIHPCTLLHKHTSSTTHVQNTTPHTPTHIPIHTKVLSYVHHKVTLLVTIAGLVTYIGTECQFQVSVTSDMPRYKVFVKDSVCGVYSQCSEWKTSTEQSDCNIAR